MTDKALWRCPTCKEIVPSNFDVCWNCGTSREGVPDPTFVPAISFHPQCETCGYLLLGLNENRCPECGQPFDRSKKDTPRPLPKMT
jgi:rRNA maturation endonuclease Nob1